MDCGEETKWEWLQLTSDRSSDSSTECPLLLEWVSDWFAGGVWAEARRERRQGRPGMLSHWRRGFINYQGVEDPARVTSPLPGHVSFARPEEVSGMGWPGHRSLRWFDWRRVTKALFSTSSHSVTITFGELFLRFLDPSLSGVSSHVKIPHGKDKCVKRYIYQD